MNQGRQCMTRLASSQALTGSLGSAVAKNVHATSLESALSVFLDVNSFRMSTYTKKGGGGYPSAGGYQRHHADVLVAVAAGVSPPYWIRGALKGAATG